MTLLKETSLPLLSHMASTNTFLSQSPVQKRLSIYNWNPGPRRGKEDSFEKQIAVKWHIVTLQEASDYVDHDILQETISRDPLCGLRDSLRQGHLQPQHRTSNLSTFMTQGEACKIIFIEGEQGWVLQGVLSRAIFRRPPVSGQKYFTVLSLHISNIHAKKKGIAKKLILTLRAIMISQEVDLVAGDFNGTAWRSRSRDNLSTIDEAFAGCALPTPPGPHTTVGT